MSQPTENKMGTMPINKLLISMSVPLMVSMLIQALYNVVDSMFVSWYDTNAFNALSLAFPVQNLLIAIAVGTGVGVNALLSRKLGQKDFDGANKIATNGLFIAICSYVVFAIVGLLFVKPFFQIQIDNQNTINFGVQYLSICIAGSLAVFVQIMFERFMQSTGKTLCVLLSHSIGAVVNIILDPLLIFSELKIGEITIVGANLGVYGAALATVIGQICGMIFAIVVHHYKNHEVRLQPRGFKPCKETIVSIYKVALPSIVMQSIGSVMVFTFNKVLLMFSEAAVSVFGVYFKLQSFILMPVIGMNNGMVPIISYNYGAQKRKRITKVIKYASIYAVVIMALGIAIFQIFPDQIFAMFNPTEQMLKIGALALQIISTHFIFAGVSIVLSSTFQAFGHAWKSMIVSIARQLVVLIPVAYLLSKTGDVNAVWWSFPIAEIVCLIICIIFYIDLYKKIIKNV